MKWEIIPVRLHETSWDTKYRYEVRSTVFISLALRSSEDTLLVVVFVDTYLAHHSYEARVREPWT